MEKADISVLLTSRNDAKMWPMALAHLERQTFPAARFELLVVDQCSDDNTADIVEKFASGAPMRTRLLRQEELNRGKAYFSETGNLGEFVLVDFVRNRRGRIR